MDNNPSLTTEPFPQSNPNPVAVPPTPVMPSSSQEPEKKNPKWLFILLAGIVIILLTGGAFYLGKSAGLKPQSPETPRACTDEAMVCPDGSAVGRTGPNCEFAACPSTNKSDTTREPSGSAETANWKTYTNSKIGIEFKYPPIWQISDYVDNYGFVIIDKSIIEIPAGTEFMAKTMTIGINQCLNATTNEKLPCEKTVQERVTKISNLMVPSTVKNKPYIVSNKNGEQIEGKTKPDFPGGDQYIKETILPLSNYLFVATLYDPTLESLYTQILSTFKFAQ
ncbi:MAG: hypothetical protein Q7K11_01705 [Candidatus Berkelbacteria bacterium]|nr:hypothetical protein [Candidatus Berkelbacteria bacterium]